MRQLINFFKSIALRAKWASTIQACLFCMGVLGQLHSYGQTVVLSQNFNSLNCPPGPSNCSQPIISPSCINGGASHGSPHVTTFLNQECVWMGSSVEGIFLNVPFEKYKRYEIYLNYLWRGASSVPKSKIRLVLTNGLIHNGSSCSGSIPVVPLSARQDVATIQQNDDLYDIFYSDTIVFCAEKDYTQLWIYPEQVQSGGVVHIDNVRITSSYSPVCCPQNPTSNFSLSTNCNNGNYSVSVAATDASLPNHSWTLMETNEPNTTIGGVVSGPVKTGIDATFTGLNLSKFYYVIHRVWLEGCFDTLETRILVPVPQLINLFHTENSNDVRKREFCFGEDVYLDGTASQGEQHYWIGIDRRPAGSSGPFSGGYATLGWQENQTVGEINLSQAFANMGYYFQTGYEYKVKLALQNLANCVAWTEKEDVFTVKCCPGYFSANFKLNRVSAGTGPGTYKLFASDYETYANVNAQHKWYVLSSPNLNGGPYTSIAELTGPEFAILVPGELCYFVIHRVITPCEEVCYGESDCINAGRVLEPCDLCGPVDCSILERVCDSPTNPRVNCGTFGSDEFRWNPVPGVGQYVVEIIFNDPACCKTELPTLLATHTTSINSLPLNSIRQPLWDCLRWRVAAVCDSSFLIWSDYSCFSGCGERGGERSIPADETTVPPTTTIYPNPAQNTVEIIFEHPFTGNIQLIDAIGHTITRQEITEQTKMQLNLEHLPSGLYQITTQNNTEQRAYKLIKQ